MLWSLIYWLLRRLVARVARGADGQRDVEYVVLRYQIKLLSRQKSGRLQLRTSDRAVLAAAALFLPRERRSCLLWLRTRCAAGIGSSFVGERRALRASRGDYRLAGRPLRWCCGWGARTRYADIGITGFMPS